MDVGFLGLGMMGAPMAERLMGGGHRLIVHDVRSSAVEPLVAAGAVAADNLRELAERCEVLVVSLPNLETARAVLVASAAQFAQAKVRTLINTCTTGPVLAEEAAAALAAHGVALVDCPISGGPAGAREGTLSVMVSGDPATVSAVRPLLSLWGTTVTVVGDRPGDAQTVKLVNNVLAAVAIVASSEALVMGAKAGLAPEAMIRAVNAGAGRNGATLSIFPRSVLPRTFDFGSPIDMLLKDVELAIQLGERLGIPMWVCQAARLVIKHAQFAGHGPEDITALFRIIEDGAGFPMPVS